MAAHDRPELNDTRKRFYAVRPSTSEIRSRWTLTARSTLDQMVHFVDGAIRLPAETLHDFFRVLKSLTKRKNHITPLLDLANSIKSIIAADGLVVPCDTSLNERSTFAVNMELVMMIQTPMDHQR
jgi:hypothetical protein